MRIRAPYASFMTGIGRGVARASVALGYLAGLLEGEGSFLRPKPPAQPGPGVALEMTDEDVVHLAADLMEARVFPNPARKPGHKNAYVCRLRGGTAADLMRV